MITRRPVLFGAAAAGLLAPRGLAQSATDFQGEWNGLLAAGSVQLHLRLVIGTGPSVVLYSVDQGNAAIPGASVQIDGARFSANFPSVQASYDGRLSNGRIEGTFTQGAAIPLAFQRGAIQAAAPQALTQASLAAIRAQCGSPALAAAARNRDGRQIEFVDGLRVMGRPETVTTSDKWHLGSITKSMTATLVARCVEAGVLSWTDTVGAVLGGAVPTMRAEYRDVSLRHLCCHRAGLQANIDLSELIAFARESQDARADRVRYAGLALAQAPLGPREQTFTYSNSGYVIVAAMLEAKLNAPWEQLIRERVFAPLGMESAGFGAPGTPGAYDQPVGHAPDASGALQPFPPGGAITDNPAVLGPAGRVHASLADVFKYLTAHRDGLTPFLRRESWNVLHTPPFGGEYAMGWIKRGDVYWHNGSNTLWYAEVMFDSQRGIASAAAANDGNIASMRQPVGAVLVGAAQAVA